MEQHQGQCYYCRGGGELLCCDGCIYSFHPVCLNIQEIPADAIDMEWLCPECHKNLFNKDNVLRRGSAGYLEQAAARAVREGNATTAEVSAWLKERTRDSVSILPVENEEDDESTVARRSLRTRKRSDKFVTSRLFDPHDNSVIERTAISPTSQRNASSSIIKNKARNNEDRWGASAHVSVGGTYQTHYIPPLFLDAHQHNIEYDVAEKDALDGNIHLATGELTRATMRSNKNGGVSLTVADQVGVDGCIRDAYVDSTLDSALLRPSRIPDMDDFDENPRLIRRSKNARGKGNEKTPKLIPVTQKSHLKKHEPSLVPSHVKCKLVWSPYILKTLNNEFEGQSIPGLIRNDASLDLFIDQCRRDWPDHIGYPFLVEFALQLLHNCDYNYETAFTVMRSPDFDFARRCEGPTEPYLNKWQPKDVRCEFPSTPYPWILSHASSVDNGVNSDQNSVRGYSSQEST